MNWQKVLSKLSIPGIALLALGAVAAATQANRFCKNERLCMAVRIAGLILALLGAAILLDVFPGL